MIVPAPSTTASRHKPRKVPKWLYPAADEHEYQRRLTEVANATVAGVERFVIPVLSVGRTDDAESKGASWYEALRQSFADALFVAAASLPPGTMGEWVRTTALRVVRFNAVQFHRMLRTAYGVDILKGEPGIAALMSMWEGENLRLIRSIPTQYLAILEGRVVAAVQRGDTLRTLMKLVRDTYPMPRHRAELIARDQIGKLNGQLTRYRQQNIGITEYRWRGVLDERERDEHVAREGNTYRWDTPPSDGCPGEPIRCRCWAAAVLPSLDDLDALIVH